MSGWGCPHDDRGSCVKVGGKPCDPGMKGCVLAGRFVFSVEEKNRPSRRRKALLEVLNQDHSDDDSEKGGAPPSA